MIIYPSYFNKKYSRKEGRKVPLGLASDPNPDKIEEILKRMNLKYEKQINAYPKHWYEDKIRFYIETDKKKSDLLREIAKNLKNY